MRFRNLLLAITLMSGAFVCGALWTAQQGEKQQRRLVSVSRAGMPNRHLGDLAPEMLSSLVSAQTQGYELDRENQALFDDIYRFLRMEYVEKIEDPSVLAEGAAVGMLAYLRDANAALIPPEFEVIRNQEEKGIFWGIGASLQIRRAPEKGSVEQLQVVAPIKGGGAEAANLQPGDIITEIDGQTVTGYDGYLSIAGADDGDPALQPNIVKSVILRQHDGPERLKKLIEIEAALVKLAKTKEGVAQLKIRREGEKELLNAAVRFGETKAPAASSRMLPEGVGYIQIPYFTSGTLTKVKGTLAEFGKKKTRTVILDLRRCSGGAFDESVKVAELILGGGVVGQIEQKLQKPAQIPKGAKAGGSPKFAYTVLIDKGTAGVAELIVGGLRERSGAKVVGESSFGDDVVVDVVDEEVMRFHSGRKLQLPVGRLLTAKGTRFRHKGFSPDVKVAYAGPLGTENDLVLAKARDLAKQAKAGRASKGGTE